MVSPQNHYHLRAFLETEYGFIVRFLVHDNIWFQWCLWAMNKVLSGNLKFSDYIYNLHMQWQNSTSVLKN